MLEFEGVEAVYDDVVLALRGVSLKVEEGAIVAILGANGAGKTSALRACTGLLPVHRGKVVKGQITFDGKRIDHAAAPDIVAGGIAQVMEGRRIYAELTVEENLKLGGFAKRGETASGLKRMYELFPVLAERSRRTAGYLSGGEQQMLAIGRALMSQPRCLLLDEPSLGLAPKIISQIRDLIVQINAEGTTVVLVEQNAAMALSIATHGYVLENGRVVVDRPAAEMREDDDIREFYLGLGAGSEHHSYRDVKHYRRRKRWAA